MNVDTAQLRVKSAARTIELLNVVANSKSGASAPEIAKSIGSSRQVVYHILHTLEEIGAVQKGERGHYVLGVGLMTIVSGFLRQVSLQEVLTPLVQSTAKITGETAYVAQWINGDAVVVASASGSNSIRAAELAIGTRGQSYARASGKLLMSELPDSVVAQYLEQNQLIARTDQTITDPKEFIEELAKIRESQISYDIGEFDEELHCLALPIPTLSQLCVSISAPKERFEKNKERYISQISQIIRESDFETK